MARHFILHLIRHAPTAGNKAKQYIGWTDEPIEPLEQVCTPPVPVSGEIWGSDLQRCRQTAAVLYPGIRYCANSDWRECHFGRWEGKTYNELMNDQSYRNWIDDPFGHSPPEGESLAVMARRIERAVLALPDGDSFTVITHGGPIRYLLARCTGKPFNEQIVRHGCCYTLEWSSKSAFEEGKRCLSYSAAPITENADM